MFEHEARIEYITTRSEQMRRDWPATPSPRYAVGGWLIRLGQRLAPEPGPRSAFAHEALPRC